MGWFGMGCGGGGLVCCGIWNGVIWMAMVVVWDGVRWWFGWLWWCRGGLEWGEGQFSNNIRQNPIITNCINLRVGI
ncbi:hypothetical protein Pint_05561 [Pistacia integerrima]|uniref:Uncharacterized protein n=1 Tax=Pistacia integerrima TaxID=434235 RepID=A0ACC0Z3H1_9ROSI|nr:hypothetical protein Pint_05561 [Pistacia integerrima]